MKKLLMVLLLSACSNDAITFAHVLDPSSKCSALVTTTGWGHDHTDTATCRSGHELLLCTVDTSGSSRPTCEKIKDIPLEKSNGS